jgi:hypothetical protein
MKRDMLKASQIWVHSARKSNTVLFKYWIRRPRSALVRTLEKILIGNSLSSVLVRDIASLSRFSFAMSDVKYIKEVEGAVLVNRPQTKITGRFVGIQDSRRAILRYNLSNTHLHTPSGHLLVCGGFLCEEFFGQYIAVFSAGTIANEYYALKHAKKQIKGTWAAIGVPQYYFHYVAQFLPALLRSLKDEEVEGVILNAKAPEWVFKSVTSAGFKVLSVRDECVVIENLVVTSVGEIITDSEVAVLRNAYAHIIEDSKPETLVFVGRHGLNRNLGKIENELEDLVSSNNGQIVNPAALGWENELRTFANCRKLILVYGSATANVVWMKPGSKVLLLTDFSRYTTQVEKAFFEACNVDWKEIDTSQFLRLEGRLLESVIDFIKD